MRIALVTSSFLPRIGGAEFIVHNLAHQWSCQGHEVCVMNNVTSDATHANGEYTVRQFKVLRGNSRFGAHRFPFQWYALRGLKRLLDQFKPDFISAHFGYPVGYWLSRIKPVPRFLITCHGLAITEKETGPRKRYGDRLLAEAMNRAAGVIAYSTYARRFLEQMGVDPSNILDIPNGVDLKRFETKSSFDFRARFGIPDDGVVVLSVGRETVEKDYGTGIKAFARFSSKVPGVYYVILGRAVSKWRSLADELGLAENLILCNGLYGDELIGAYQQTDIFFLPSVWETGPLVVIEAMASGLAEVVTNVGANQDLVDPGDNGFIVEPGDTDSMADVLYRLATDKSLRKRMGEASLSKSKSYGWDRISRMYLEHA